MLRSPVKILVGIAALSLISGCSNYQERHWGWCAVGGAVVGGVAGAGLGLGIANAATRSGDNVFNEERGKAMWLGAIGGAALGTLAGHFLCDPLVQPPVPPPQPPPPPPLPPPPPPPPPKQKLVLRGVHFDFNKYNIRPGDAAVLDEVASILKANPNVTVDVNGYCDAIGSVEYNLKLSERRANAVVDYLVNAGIPASRLIPHGYGKTNFVATNDTPEGRAQNRRVELVPVE